MKVNEEGYTLSHRRPASLSVGGELMAYVKMSKIPATCPINRQRSKLNIIIMQESLSYTTIGLSYRKKGSTQREREREPEESFGLKKHAYGATLPTAADFLHLAPIICWQILAANTR